MICPNCQTDVPVTEQNYGALYTCGHCQAVYFVNFEGQPEFGDTTQEPAPDESLNFSNPADEARQDSSLDAILDAAAFGSPPSSVEEAQSFQSQENSESAPLSFSDSELNPFESQAAGEFLAQEQAAPVTDSSAFGGIAREISDFGNEEVQLAGLNYDLKITGLDTVETKRLFKEAIDDSKFGWDAGEIFRGIANGEIEITRLSPAKAYILARRLQFLDVEKQWKQNVLS